MQSYRFTGCGVQPDGTVRRYDESGRLAGEVIGNIIPVEGGYRAVTVDRSVRFLTATQEEAVQALMSRPPLEDGYVRVVSEWRFEGTDEGAEFLLRAFSRRNGIPLRGIRVERDS